MWKKVPCPECNGNGYVCQFTDCSILGRTCSACDGLGYVEAPQTIADRIRAMSDKELADWLARTQIANIVEVLAVVKIPYKLKDGLEAEVAKDCLKWLIQPAEGKWL